MLNGKGKLNTFTVNYTSTMDGQEYPGTFTSRKISIMDQAKVSRRKSELCGGMYCVRDDDGNPTGQGIDEWTEWMNQMIAMLEIVLISKPEWWKLEEIYDEGLVVAVFEEVMLFENSFRRPAGAKAPSQDGSGSGQGNSQDQHTQPVPSDNAPQMVDQQVQPSLDA